MNIANFSKLNLREHPWLFGTYANMAMHNVYIVLNHIAEHVKLGQFDNESKMWEKSQALQMLNPDNKAEDKPAKCNRIIEMLHEHFPFLKYLYGHEGLNAENRNPTLYYHVMQLMLEMLEKQRNFCSHAIHEEEAVKEKLLVMLKYIFDGSLPTLKERFGFDEKALVHLRRYEGEAKERDKKTGKYRIKPKPNAGFYFSLAEKRNQKFYFSENGLAFFLSLFLEKNYAYLFLKKLKHFKESKAVADKATFELFTISSMRIPQVKLKSDKSNTALLLDMLNELQRCPKELFDTLSQEDRDKFIRKEGVETDDENMEPETVLLRKQNRFPYFALRYIDEQQIFKSLRFHINLGKFTFKTYTQQIDGVQYTRRWEKRLLTFGRLNDFGKEKRPALWADLVKDPSEINDDLPAPYITDTAPHYQFENNSIGLKNTEAIGKAWLSIEPGKKPLTLEPDFYISNDELQGLIFYDLIARELNFQWAEKGIDQDNKKWAENVIFQYNKKINKFLDAIINMEIHPLFEQKITNEQVAKDIALYIKNQEKYETEYSRRKNALAGLLAKYSLEPHQVPDAICRYIMAIEPVEIKARAADALKRLIEETDILLERIGVVTGKKTAKKEVSKKVQRKRAIRLHLKAGDRALFLAKDMIFLQPAIRDKNDELKGGKPNPTEFQVLQARLAFFQRYKKLLPDIFEVCRLTGNKENPHPFLKKIDLNKCDTSYDFYKRYLQERKNYLEHCKKATDVNKMQFLKLSDKQKNAEYFSDWAKTVKQKPKNLPRGLFKDALNILLKEKAATTHALTSGQNETGKENNIVFYARKYYEELKDANQPFYNFKKNYHSIDKIHDKREGSRDPIKKHFFGKDEITKEWEKQKKKSKDNEKEKQLYDYLCIDAVENEKLLRHIATSDLVLFLMCKQILKKENENVKNALQKNFFLNTIMFNDSKSILNNDISFDFTLSFYKSVREKKSRKSQKNSIPEKTINANFKIKDYGKTRRFLKDRRIEFLLAYYKKDTISIETLKKELDEYERNRLGIFHSIYTFERAIKNSQLFQKWKKEILSSHSITYIDHQKILQVFAKQFPEMINQEEIKLLLDIRNKISHNQFPAFEDHQSIFIDDGDFSLQLASFMINKYQAFTKKINYISEVKSKQII